MTSYDLRLPFRDVVVIADVLYKTTSIPIVERRDLESTEPETLQDLIEAIRNLGKQVHHYQNPKALAENAHKHVDDVVFSIFGGSHSRNRMALVPAICEAFGLPFVGPDTYGRIICQDKEISKAIASSVGLKIPAHRLVRTENDIKFVLDFPVPYVAKPLFEGSSIGIGPDNLVADPSRGGQLLAQMLKQFGQPILIETFIPGREVSWCFIDAPGKDKVRSFAEMVWHGEPDHFDHNLYDAPHKAIAEGRKTICDISHELSAELNDSFEQMIEIIGDIGYGRIDGKFKNNEFVFLEITPDAWVGPTGTFVSSFTNEGLSFEEIIARVLLSARRVLPDR